MFNITNFCPGTYNFYISPKIKVYECDLSGHSTEPRHFYPMTRGRTVGAALCRSETASHPAGKEHISLHSHWGLTRKYQFQQIQILVCIEVTIQKKKKKTWQSCCFKSYTTPWFSPNPAFCYLSFNVDLSRIQYLTFCFTFSFN